MTELCDYFKVWFPQVARLHDPDDLGKLIQEETPSTQAKACISQFNNRNVVVGFSIERGSLPTTDFLQFLISAGHARILSHKDYARIEDLLQEGTWDQTSAFVVVDRIKIKPGSKIEWPKPYLLASPMEKAELKRDHQPEKSCHLFILVCALEFLEKAMRS